MSKTFNVNLHRHSVNLGFFLFAVLCCMAGCIVEHKNCYTITGGQFRLLSPAEIDNDTITFRKATKQDTSLWIGLLFEVEPVADGSEVEYFPVSFQREGRDGILDSIQAINISAGKKEYRKALSNPLAGGAYMLKDIEVLKSKSGRGFILKCLPNAVSCMYPICLFEDIDEMVAYYNSDTEFYPSMHFMEIEIVFKFDPNLTVSYNNLEDLQIKVRLSDGSIVELERYEEE